MSPEDKIQDRIDELDEHKMEILRELTDCACSDTFDDERISYLKNELNHINADIELLRTEQKVRRTFSSEERKITNRLIN